MVGGCGEEGSISPLLVAPHPHLDFMTIYSRRVNAQSEGRVRGVRGALWGGEARGVEGGGRMRVSQLLRPASHTLRGWIYNFALFVIISCNICLIYFSSF